MGPASYSYGKENKKCIEQTVRNGRVSILETWQPDQALYALACGSFNSESYIQNRRLDCKLASQTFRTAGRMTV